MVRQARLVHRVLLVLRGLLVLQVLLVRLVNLEPWLVLLSLQELVLLSWGHQVLQVRSDLPALLDLRVLPDRPVPLDLLGLLVCLVALSWVWFWASLVLVSW